MSAFAARRNAVEIGKVRSFVVNNQVTAFLPAMHDALCQLRTTLHNTLARRTVVQTMRQLTHDRPPHSNFSLSHTSRNCESTAPQCQPVSDPPEDTNYHHEDDTHTLDDDMDDDTRSTYHRLCAAKTKPNKKHGPQRQGAKRAKAMERLTNAEGALDPEQATGYRALSARGNYLSQDRADISYSTKELCRDFCPAKSQKLR